MAWTLVANVNAPSTVSNSVTSSSINTTGADLIVISVSKFAQTGVNVAGGTVSDNKGNTWTGLTAKNTTNSCARLFYCYSPTVGSGHTFSHSQGPGGASGSDAFAVLAVMAFSSAITSPFDVQNGGTTASGTSLATGSITPSVSGALLVSAGCFNNASNTMSIDNSFNQVLNSAYAAGLRMAAAAAWKEHTSGAINPTWSWSGARDSAVVIAAFKPAAAASGKLLTQMQQYSLTGGCL